MNKTQHMYIHDKIIIGGTLNALIYSYINNIPIIFNVPKPPYFFEHFQPDTSLERFFIKPDILTLQGTTNTKEKGNSKLELWDKLTFILSLSGLMPLADKTLHLRIENEKNILKVITKNHKMIKFKFDKLIIFDDENVHGLPTPKKSISKDDKKLVLDWIDVRRGMQHQFDYCVTDDDFVNRIHFYKSDRLCGDHDKKDIVSFSYLTFDELNSYEFSDTYAKFKILHLMKKAGIKGPRNGRRQNDPTKYIHYAIRIEPTRREVKEIAKNIYDNTDKLIFNHSSEEELIQNSTFKEKGYSAKINQYLFCN